MSTTQPIAPLKFPLESYVCRSYLRFGECRFGSGHDANGDAAQPVARRQQREDTLLSETDVMRLATITPPSSRGSSSEDDERCRTVGHVGSPFTRGHSQSGTCKYLHLSADDVLPTLERLVSEGWGFVTCCINFQNRNGCSRSLKSAPMCKYLHLTSREEAEWTARMHPHVRELRKAYTRNEERRVAERHNAGSTEVAGGALRIEPRVVPGLDPSQPPIVVGGSASLGYCHQYMRGQCFRGSECRYRHIDLATRNVVSSLPAVAVANSVVVGSPSHQLPTVLLPTYPHQMQLLQPLPSPPHAATPLHHQHPHPPLQIGGSSSSSSAAEEAEMESIAELLKELRQ